MADVHLPTTLMPLFAGLPRRRDRAAAPGAAAIGRLGPQGAGVRGRGTATVSTRTRDRLSVPRRGVSRQHSPVYVDRERAGLETPLEPRSRVDVIAAISGG